MRRSPSARRVPPPGRRATSSLRRGTETCDRRRASARGGDLAAGHPARREPSTGPSGRRLVSMKVVALAGGVGAGKFLRGLVRVVPPSDVTVIVNTGDDIELHGLRICP